MGAYFSICSVIYIAIFIYFFFSKQKVQNAETNVYKYFIITTFIGLVFDVLGFAVYKLGYHVDTFLYRTIAKIMLLYFVAWSFEFLYYIYAVSYSNSDNIVNNKIKNFKKFLITLFLMFFLLIIVLPIKFKVLDDVVYPESFVVGLTYLIFALSILSAAILCFINTKRIVSKKYMPVYLLLVLIIIIFFVQKMFPQLFLVNFALSLIVIIMYFTIENPDLKMLENYHDAKQYADDLNTEKQMFIYNMSQEMKNPLLKTSKFCEDLLYSDSIEEYKNGVRSIKSECNSLIQSINETFDIETTDIRDLGINSTKYDLYNILKFVSNSMEDKVKKSNKKVEFVYSVSDTLPKELIGDPSGIKKVLKILFDNALEHTEQGFIELKVQGLSKGNVCRLMISLEDSGEGIDAQKLEKVFERDRIKNKSDNGRIDSNNENLALAKKIINVLGGNLIINSELTVGTKVRIVLDQEFVQKIENSDIKRYEEKYFDKNQVLLLGGTDEEKKVLMRYIAANGGVMDIAENMNEAIDKINMRKRYSAFIFDGDMPYHTIAQMTERIKAIKGFNSKLIVLTSDKTMKSSKKRAIIGIQGYIPRPIDDKNIEKNLIINDD